MGQTAESIGANVFQFFTRNPRGGAAKAIDKADVAAFTAFAAERGIGPILAHAPYTLNAAGSETRVREFAQSVMTDDLKRLEYTPGALYNFHPGSHVGQGTEAGITLISGMLNRICEAFGGGFSTTVLLETMAGKGSEVGGTFEELRAIIDRVEFPLGVCLDTCHVWDGGYDIAGDLDGGLAEFDGIIGLDRLKAVHINDSLNERGARKDRHAKIGKGKIGLDAFASVVNHPKLRDLPFYLETPCDLQGYKEEIALLRGLRG
jgi:deoxyribonuclease-4